ncbi:MAG: acylneuraminate cytidylyltransferase family protein [Halobacteriovoraceae bacterium]|nr:acylneuraminate cytidylyltransferase family protein [Halobacteriovoraceae bacterium]
MKSSKKVIAMIPARYGSKRVKKKNLRLINGKPLISYVIETVKKVKGINEIYINSEHKVFKKIAEEHGVNFYKRPEIHSSDTSTNDEFALDFMENVEGDVLLQILPTSPLITVEEIEGFLDTYLDKDLDSLISVEEAQIASLYKGGPLNFDPLKINPPSQTMTPVLSYATVLMAWSYDSFKENMKKYGAAYHGGDSRKDFYPLRGLSTVDIDREEDFHLAEALLVALNSLNEKEAKYYDEENL